MENRAKKQNLMCKGRNTKLPDWYWIVIVYEICAETCAWNTGSMNCLLQDLNLFTFFFTLATIFLITIFMGITLLFFENLGLCSPLKEGFICECGKRATPDSLISKNLCTTLICPPNPLFLRQLFEPRDLLGDRSTCEKLEFRFLLFPPRSVFFCILHVDCQQRSWNG